MFSGLRQGSLFYILQKGENPVLKTGQVVSISNPKPKYNTTQPQIFGQQIETTVDVCVKVGEDNYNLKELSSNFVIQNYDKENLVVSESREAMSSEVEAMLRTSKQLLESVPFHEKVIASCDIILRELNPQFAKEKEQEERIGMLEGKVTGIDGKLDEVMGMLSKIANSSNNNSKKQ